MDPIIPQPQEQAPIPSPKHFINKKFMVTFVILMLFGSGAYAGIWYWGNQQLTQEVVPTFTPRIDETADWKIYTNTQYGFEFKYPNQIYISEAGAIFKEYQGPSGEKRWLWIGVAKATQKEKVDLEGRNLGDKYKTGLVDNTIILIGGNKAEESIIVNYPATDEYLITAGFFDKNSNLIYLNLEIDGNTIEVAKGDIKNINLFNQILSTFKFTDSNQGPTACTQEAKQCSDGSYVGRTGPNCEFTACPGDGILTGHVAIGPNCPVEQAGNPCTPAPQAYTSRQVVVYKADGTTLVATQNFDTQGNYNIVLTAGTYVVKSKTGISSVASVVGTVIIKNGQTSTLNFSIDTGIR